MMVVDWDGQSPLQLTDTVERLATLGVDMAVIGIADNDPPSSNPRAQPSNHSSPRPSSDR